MWDGALTESAVATFSSLELERCETDYYANICVKGNTSLCPPFNLMGVWGSNQAQNDSDRSHSRVSSLAPAFMQHVGKLGGDSPLRFPKWVASAAPMSFGSSASSAVLSKTVMSAKWTYVATNSIRHPDEMHSPNWQSSSAGHQFFDLKL